MLQSHMSWKILRVAEQAWRKLNAPELLPLVASGVPFKDGRMIRSGRVTCNGNDQVERTAAGTPIYTPIDMTSTRAVGTPTRQMLTIAALVPARGSNHRQTGERTRDTPGNIDTVAHTALRPSSMTIALRAIVIATGSITAKSSGDV